MKADLEIKRFTRFGTGQFGLRGTLFGSLAAAQVEFAQMEMARAGRIFHGGTQLAANGIGPSTALPTTAPPIALVNTGGGDNERAHYVDHLHFWLASGTPAVGATLWACISRGKLTTLPANTHATGWDAGPTNGRLNAATNARWQTGITMPAGTVWASVGGSLQPATASIGLSDQPFRLQGSLCIPPGYAMGLALLSPAGTTPLYGVSARWGDAESDLEP